MTVEVGLWRLGDRPEKVRFVPIPKEEKLEDILAADLSILDPRLLLIGRQVLTGFGKYIDLLAMDADGKLVVIELKRDKTPREIVAQTLDYGSWIRELENDAIAAIFDAFLSKYHPEQSGISLDDAFQQKFGGIEPPENWNEGHELLIVAGHLDASTERIVNYLNDEHGVAINAVFFRFFVDEGREYLSRVWLIDPTEVEVKSVEAKSGEPWNGEFYANFGHGESRRWEDGRKFGYLAAGNGTFYVKTLALLEPGNRIWVNVPGTGYVGVGIVEGEPTPIGDFRVPLEDGTTKPIADVISPVPNMDLPEDEIEHYVKVRWVETTSLNDAVKERGLFGNQNTVARPKSAKWAHTIERLRKRFRIKD
ncbi:MULTISPECIES: endonuclease NucS domain-containing protein [Rhodopirellula]|uniref:endonuclease NucS domain-containing protein n=1 Tax=Rhodopirellula TaxID=265488 RepID=UPI00257AF752|nr:endonuclease NucS domain-containing protein [Rhodopirellula sp. UBA1907]